MNIYTIVKNPQIFLIDFAPRYGGAILFRENNFIESFYTDNVRGRSSSKYFLNTLRKRGYLLDEVDPYTYFPITVFLYIPFSFFNFKISGLLFLFVSISLLIYSFYLLKKKERFQFDFLIFLSLLLISTPFRHSFFTANSELLSISFMIFSLYLNPVIAGFLLSLSIFIKPHSIFFALYFLLRDFKKFIYTILFILLGIVMSFFIFGKELIFVYFKSTQNIIGTFQNYATFYNFLYIIFKEDFKLVYFFILLIFTLFYLFLLLKTKTKKFLEIGGSLNISLLFLPLFQLYYILRFFPYFFTIFEKKNRFNYIYLFSVILLFFFPFRILKKFPFIYPLLFFIIYIVSIIDIIKLWNYQKFETNKEKCSPCNPN